MTTGWPQNQQDLRSPSTEDDEDRPAPAQAGQEHPSLPLPVGRGRSQRGWGRGRGRDEDPAAGVEDDDDYGWIKYLGAAGPAQETSRRTDPKPPASRPAASPADSWRTAPGRDASRSSVGESWQTEPPGGQDPVAPRRDVAPNQDVARRRDPAPAPVRLARASPPTPRLPRTLHPPTLCRTGTTATPTRAAAGKARRDRPAPRQSAAALWCRTGAREPGRPVPGTAAASM